MLILTRKMGESIIIGTNREIEITVLNINGNQVRLGVVADKDIPVHRDEIYRRIQTQQNTRQQREDSLRDSRRLN